MNERRAAVALALALSALWFAALAGRPLFNPDEGRYAEIAREMLASGDWVVPHLNGVPYVEKPPLQYWLTAAGLAAFGPTAFAARLYASLCGLGTLGVVWLTARRLWNASTAWRAVAVLGGMGLFPVLAQLLTLDMSLTFYLTAALGAFLRAQSAGDAPPGSAEARAAGRWMLVAWAASALGVLTKGIVAAAIPAATLVLYSVLERDLAVWCRLAVARGLPLFLLITVPWHLLAALRLPDFLDFYFVHEHLARYLTPSADRQEAWWFFGAVFLLGCLPFTVPAVRVLIAGARRGAPAGRFHAARFLWVWALFIGVFFSFSDSKLIPYLLPALPAVALLIAASPPEALRRDLVSSALLCLLGGLALIVVAVRLPALLPPSAHNALFLSLARPALAAGALFAAAGALVLTPRGRGGTRDAAVLGAGAGLAWLLLMRAAAAVAPAYSGVDLAAALRGVPAATPIYSVATYDQTLTFYLRRTVTLVAYRGELDYGLRHEPAAAIPSVAAFVARWADEPQAYAVMEMPMYERLRSEGVPMREVAGNLRRLLVARR